MGTSRLLANHTIAIIGAGNMGRAIIGGLLKGRDTDAGQIRAARRSQRALKLLAEQFPGIQTTSNNIEAVEDASIVILAVKPQTVVKVIKEIKASVNERTLIISVLAGITTQTLQERFGLNLPVVRTMPNTPALVDEGATAICGGDYASDEDLDYARAVFEAVGSVGSCA